MLQLPQLVFLKKTNTNKTSKYIAVGDVVDRALLFQDLNAVGEIERNHSGLSAVWVNGEPLLIKGTRLSFLYLLAKRSLDIFVAGLALVILSPLLISAFIAIKLTSSGSAIFKQKRIGYNNQPFFMYKFRTMFSHKCCKNGVVQARKDDERVTRIGKILRKTSLDELPQLINILKGEMSLVGPRPFVPNQLANGKPYKQVVPYYDLRHHVVPGLTGWAQANGYRGLTDDKELAIARIEHDIAYIQNASFLLDIKILFLTAWREFITGNGH